MENVGIAMGWVMAIFLGALALVIIIYMIIGKINLEKLISEPSGDASISRFQFLIFTFVIAIGLFLITVSGDKPSFPEEIPVGLLGLLGISGGSYVVSKAIRPGKQQKK